MKHRIQENSNEYRKCQIQHDNEQLEFKVDIEVVLQHCEVVLFRPPGAQWFMSLLCWQKNQSYEDVLKKSIAAPILEMSLKTTWP